MTREKGGWVQLREGVRWQGATRGGTKVEGWQGGRVKPDWIQGYMYTLGRRGLRVSNSPVSS